MKTTMGKIIEFYHPTPKRPLKNQKTQASETVTKAEFDAQVAEETLTAKQVLEEILTHADVITDVLIMIRDMDGQMGFVTNVDGFSESITFMERIKHRALEHDASNMGGYNPGSGDVS
jgi:hypothetical protein